MRRVPHTPRPNATELVRAQGLVYASETKDDGQVIPYWYEKAAYEFSSPEIDMLAGVTENLHAMAMSATARMVRDPEILRRVGLPELFWPVIQDSFEDPNTLSMYGRFDLAYGGPGTSCPVPKLLEYNAETPAGLVEAAVTQWNWLEALHPDKDQWCMMHEMLVQFWRTHFEPGAFVHLAYGAGEPVEDFNTVMYLLDTAVEAGLHPIQLTIENIGFHPDARAFVDAGVTPARFIETLFKMYPWDWLLATELAKEIALPGQQTRFLEPMYKLLTGSKALLPVMWEMFPNHENLLPAYFEDQSGAELSEYVAKPIAGWEGAGVTIVRDFEGVEASLPGGTEGQPKVFQQYQEIPVFDGARPVLGTWIVDGRAAGLGIRESDGLITDGSARFVPHYIDAPRTTDEELQELLTRKGQY